MHRCEDEMRQNDRTDPVNVDKPTPGHQTKSLVRAAHTKWAGWSRDVDTHIRTPTDMCYICLNTA